MHADTSARHSAQPFFGLDNLAVNYVLKMNQAHLAFSPATQSYTAVLAVQRCCCARGPTSTPSQISQASQTDVKACIKEVFPSNGGSACVYLMITIQIF